MIILPHARAVIITPPKCGSHSLHELLCRPRYKGIRLDGPQGNNEIGWHTLYISHHYKYFRKFVVVRNPYRRAWSMWSWFTQFVPGLTFEQWFKEIVPKKRKFCNPISINLHDHGINCKYWQLEHIHSCLPKVGCVEKLPKLNVIEQYHPDGVPVMKKRHADLIEDWAEIDCKAFNYKRPEFDE